MSEPTPHLGEEHAPQPRRRLPNRRPHELIDFTHDGVRYTAGVGCFEDGRLAEIFLNAGKVGTSLERNVLDDFPRLYQSDRADKLWLPEHIAAFMKVAGPEMKIALMLGMHTGQRQGDLRRLAWSGYDGQRITLRQSKGGKIVSIHCTNALRAMLDSQANSKKGSLIMTTPTGRGWTKRYFNEHWNEAFTAAGITEDLHFHDLRGTAVTMLAEAGCTVPEIVAITGHSIKHATHIIEVYLSRTKHLADAAIVKLERRLKRLQKGA